MANHGFLTSKKFFKKDKIIIDLKEINKRRFKNFLTIEETQYGTNGAWFIYCKSKRSEFPIGFNIWIKSARKIEHRHSSGFGFYLEEVFTNELGLKYDSILSDEGISDRWKPNILHRSYKEYLEDDLKFYLKEDPQKGLAFMNKLLSYIPQELENC